jgi:hypothetical protein
MVEWERNHDWVLHRVFHELTSLTIKFSGDKPSVKELIALRRCLPQFRDTSPAALRDMIGDSGAFDLGVLPTQEAREIMKALRTQGLEFVAKNASTISYLPENRTLGLALLIEDETEAARTAEEMMAAGVPVESIEA